MYICLHVETVHGTTHWLSPNLNEETIWEAGVSSNMIIILPLKIPCLHLKTYALYLKTFPPFNCCADVNGQVRPVWALNNWQDMLSFLTQKLTGEDEVCVHICMCCVCCVVFKRVCAFSIFTYYKSSICLGEFVYFLQF